MLAQLPHLLALLAGGLELLGGLAQHLARLGGDLAEDEGGLGLAEAAAEGDDLAVEGELGVVVEAADHAADEEGDLLVDEAGEVVLPLVLEALGGDVVEELGLDHELGVGLGLGHELDAVGDLERALLDLDAGVDVLEDQLEAGPGLASGEGLNFCEVGDEVARGLLAVVGVAGDRGQELLADVDGDLVVEEDEPAGVAVLLGVVDGDGVAHGAAVLDDPLDAVALEGGGAVEAGLHLGLGELVFDGEEGLGEVAQVGAGDHEVVEVAQGMEAAALDDELEVGERGHDLDDVVGEGQAGDLLGV